MIHYNYGYIGNKMAFFEMCKRNRWFYENAGPLGEVLCNILNFTLFKSIVSDYLSENVQYLRCSLSETKRYISFIKDEINMNFLSDYHAENTLTKEDVTNELNEKLLKHDINKPRLFTEIALMNSHLIFEEEEIKLIDDIERQIRALDFSYLKSIVGYVFLDEGVEFENYSAKERFLAFSHLPISKNLDCLKSKVTLNFGSCFDEEIDDNIMSELSNIKENKEYSDNQKFKLLCSTIKKHKVSYGFDYEFTALNDFLMFYITEMIDKNIKIKKCANCQKYFVPYNRSDTIYCDNISPQDSNKTCKVYGSQKTWQDKLKSDEASRLYRNAYQAKQMRVKRNPDILEHDVAFKKWKEEASQWKKDVKSGRKTNEDYIKWLQIKN